MKLFRDLNNAETRVHERGALAGTAASKGRWCSVADCPSHASGSREWNSSTELRGPRRAAAIADHRARDLMRASLGPSHQRRHSGLSGSFNANTCSTARVSSLSTDFCTCSMASLGSLRV